MRPGILHRIDPGPSLLDFLAAQKRVDCRASPSTNFSNRRKFCCFKCRKNSSQRFLQFILIDTRYFVEYLVSRSWAV
jgi:hypothetical protein